MLIGFYFHRKSALMRRTSVHCDVSVTPGFFWECSTIACIRLVPLDEVTEWRRGKFLRRSIIRGRQSVCRARAEIAQLRFMSGCPTRWRSSQSRRSSTLHDGTAGSHVARSNALFGGAIHENGSHVDADRDFRRGDALCSTSSRGLAYSTCRIGTFSRSCRCLCGWIFHYSPMLSQALLFSVRIGDHAMSGEQICAWANLPVAPDTHWTCHRDTGDAGFSLAGFFQRNLWQAGRRNVAHIAFWLVGYAPR